MKKILLSFLAALPIMGFSLMPAPWFADYEEGQLQVDYTYQAFNKLQDGSSTSYTYKARNQYLGVLFGYSPFDRWMFDADYAALRTTGPSSHHSIESDHFGIGGRYLIFSETCGDCYDLTAGINFTFPTGHGRANPGLFHHSDVDSEIQVTIGKIVPETAYVDAAGHEEQQVVKRVKGEERYWAGIAVGIGTKGAAWLHACGSASKQFRERHTLALEGDYNQGFGHQKIVGSNFPGYAHLHYSAIDIGPKYTYTFDECQDLSARYLYRIFARNCPAASNAVTVSYNCIF